jgi:hypothetical protein
MLDDLQKRGKLDADTVGVLQEILKGIGEDLQNQAKLQEALGGVQQQLQALDGQRRQMQRASYA